MFSRVVVPAIAGTVDIHIVVSKMNDKCRNMDFLPPRHALFGAAATTRWMQVARQLPVWHKSPQSHISFDCGSRSSEVCQKALTVGSKKSDVRFDSAQQSQPILMKRTTPARCLLWRHNCIGTDKSEFRWRREPCLSVYRSVGPADRSV